jgi:hypothetical protein
MAHGTRILLDIKTPFLAPENSILIPPNLPLLKGGVIDSPFVKGD